MTDTMQSLRRAVLQAAAQEPSPDRRTMRRRSRIALLAAAATVVAGFLALGGANRGERSLALTAAMVIAMVLIAVISIRTAGKAGASGGSGLQVLVGACLPALAYALAVLVGRDAEVGAAVPAMEHLACALLTSLLSAPVVAALLFSARRSDPFGPARRSAWLAAAGTALGVVVVLLHCPSANLTHDLVGHALPALVPALVGVVLGVRVLRP